MSRTEAVQQTEESDNQRNRFPVDAVALACGALGIIGAVLTYWLILPGVVFGTIAVVLGARSWRRGDREVGATAAALGIVALFLVPSVLFVVSEAEDWGRGCALNPSNPDC